MATAGIARLPSEARSNAGRTNSITTATPATSASPAIRESRATMPTVMPASRSER
ncbi:hypothetical protein ABIB27_000958 [Arthrobacter sp. UYEF21]